MSIKYTQVITLCDENFYLEYTINSEGKIELSKEELEEISDFISVLSEDTDKFRTNLSNHLKGE